MPELPPCLGIECQSIVRGGDEQNPIHRHGSHLKAAGALRMESPLGTKLRDVAGINLAERAVTTARIISIVGKPVRSDWLRKQFARVHINVDCEGGYRRILCEHCHSDQDKESETKRDSFHRTIV